MACTANPAMYVDQWMKPFGKQSDGRESLIIMDLERSAKTFADTTFGAAVRKMHQVAQSNFWKPLDLERVKPRIRQPVVKVKAYAHDRVVLSSFIQAPDIRKGLMARTSFREAVKQARLLVSRREFQACFNILGRSRFAPALTSFTTYAKYGERCCTYVGAIW